VIREGIEMLQKAKEEVVEVTGQTLEEYQSQEVIADLEREMELAARNLQFERAAELRDQIASLQTKQ
jgi:excinuclease UvrABC nuclease subunit